MAKNYILEPTEVTFDNHGEASIENENASEMFNAITEETIVTAFDKTLKYAGTANPYKFFTTDGTMETEEDSIQISFENSPGNPVKLTFLSRLLGETTTVSIYNVTEDPAPADPLAKNVTHNDHPYNAVERIRAKLKQKIDEGEDEEESGGDEGGGTPSGGGIMKLTFTEDPDAVNSYTYVCDHTWQEIHDALNNGDIVHGPMYVDAENLTVSIVIKWTCLSDGQYTLGGLIGNDTFDWAGESADEYPTATLG